MLKKTPSKHKQTLKRVGMVTGGVIRVLVAFYLLWFSVFMLQIAYAYLGHDWVTTIFSLIAGLLGAYIAIGYIPLYASQLVIITLIATNKFQLAELVLRRLIPMLSNWPMVSGRNLADLLMWQGELLMHNEFYVRAEDFFKEAWLHAAPLESPTRTDFLRLKLGLAFACFYNGNLEDADKYCSDVINTEDGDTAQRAFALGLQARTYLMLGNTRSALGLLATARTLELPPQSNYSKAASLVLPLISALARAMDSDLDGALKDYASFTAKLDSDPDLLEYATPQILCLLSNEFMKHQRFEQAEDCLSYAYLKGQADSSLPSSKETLNYYEKLLLLTDRQSEVEHTRLWLRS
jgi:tetratricopeptide (TPR) repeat protein